MGIPMSARWIAVAFTCLFLMALVTAVLAASLVDTVLDREDYHPLRYENPRDVVGETVVQEGGVIEVKSVRCNDDPLVFTSESSVFVSVEPAGITVPRPVFTQPLAAGYKEEILRYSLPAGVTPGLWRLGGRDQAVAPNGDTQTLTWYTEIFEVVPNEQD